MHGHGEDFRNRRRGHAGWHRGERCHRGRGGRDASLPFAGGDPVYAGNGDDSIGTDRIEGGTDDLIDGGAGDDVAMNCVPAGTVQGRDGFDRLERGYGLKDESCVITADLVSGALFGTDRSETIDGTEMDRDRDGFDVPVIRGVGLAWLDPDALIFRAASPSGAPPAAGPRGSGPPRPPASSSRSACVVA